METIKKYILPQPYFERMQYMDEKYGNKKPYAGMTYEQFYIWNTQCIKELPNNDLEMLGTLCIRIQNNTLRQMDMESCSIFGSDCFFFDANKRLCIVNPR